MVKVLFILFLNYFCMGLINWLIVHSRGSFTQPLQGTGPFQPVFPYGH